MLAPWATTVTLITLRDYGINVPGTQWKTKGNLIAGLPAPGDFLLTFPYFGLLAFLSDNPKTHTLAELMGWAVPLAMVLVGLNPSAPVTKKTQAQPT